jgi:hypothetical protein
LNHPSNAEVQSLDRRLRKMGFPQHSHPTYRILVSRPRLNGSRQSETCHSLVRRQAGPSQSAHDFKEQQRTCKHRYESKRGDHLFSRRREKLAGGKGLCKESRTLGLPSMPD